MLFFHSTVNAVYLPIFTVIGRVTVGLHTARAGLKLLYLHRFYAPLPPLARVSSSDYADRIFPHSVLPDAWTFWKDLDLHFYRGNALLRDFNLPTILLVAVSLCSNCFGGSGRICSDTQVVSHISAPTDMLLSESPTSISGK